MTDELICETIEAPLLAADWPARVPPLQQTAEELAPPNFEIHIQSTSIRSKLKIRLLSTDRNNYGGYHCGKNAKKCGVPGKGKEKEDRGRKIRERGTRPNSHLRGFQVKLPDFPLGQRPAGKAFQKRVKVVGFGVSS